MSFLVESNCISLVKEGYVQLLVPLVELEETDEVFVMTWHSLVHSYYIGHKLCVPHSCPSSRESFIMLH